MNTSFDALILLTEDDIAHSKQIVDLSHLGFQVHRYTDLTTLYTHVAQRAASLIVLTGPLPRINIATTQLRTMKNALGIIALPDSADSEARARTLLCGADACLDSRSSGLELAAVFQSVLRRAADLAITTGQDFAPARRTMPFAAPSIRPTEPGWRLINKGWRLVAPSGQELPLTTTERRLLLRLARAPDKKVSHESLNLYGARPVEAPNSSRRRRAVNGTISRMRSKAATHHMCLPIRAVHGWGYMFTADVVEEPAPADSDVVDAGN